MPGSFSQEVVSERWLESCEKPVTSDQAMAPSWRAWPFPGEGMGDGKRGVQVVNSARIV